MSTLVMLWSALASELNLADVTHATSVIATSSNGVAAVTAAWMVTPKSRLASVTEIGKKAETRPRAK